ncbi:hypothetical protein HY389_01385 [Candidatus Daviesbacteria bacterium]|nr:hypothetical protein [Candidatus Daviesbacteria bacterium]
MTEMNKEGLETSLLINQSPVDLARWYPNVNLLINDLFEEQRLLLEAFRDEHPRQLMMKELILEVPPTVSIEEAGMAVRGGSRILRVIHRVRGIRAAGAWRDFDQNTPIGVGVATHA